MFANRAQVGLWHEFLPHLMAQKARVLTAYAFSITGLLLALAVPWPLKFLIDGVLQQQSLPPALASMSAPVQVFLLASMMFVLAMLAATVLAFDKVTHARVREQFAFTLRDDALQGIQRLSRSSQLSERSGELVMRLLGDVSQVSRLFCKTAPLVTKHIFTALATLIAVTMISLPLGIVALVMATALAFLIIHFGPALSRAASQKRALEGQLAGLTHEIIKGIEHVQAMALEHQTRVAYLDNAAKSLHAGVEEIRVAVSLERASQILAGLSIALIAGIGGYMVVLESMSLGTLTVCLAYVTQLLKPIEKINEIAASISRSLVRARRLQDLFQAEIVEADFDGTTMPTRIRLIECQNLSYRYPQNAQDTIRGLTHRFEQGQCTAIVGASGSGKSTLLRLLMRLESPTGGQITVNGITHKEIQTYALRSQFAVLLQQSHLFAGSMREILSELRSEASDTDLENALRDVGLNDLVRSLPLGLDTQVDEAGNRISGGQRTRLLLARALVSQRPVLILDEPFANIDEESKRIVIQRLAAVKRDIILIVVTHEKELLAIADCVLCVENILPKEDSRGDVAGENLVEVPC